MSAIDAGKVFKLLRELVGSGCDECFRIDATPLELWAAARLLAGGVEENPDFANHRADADAFLANMTEHQREADRMFGYKPGGKAT